MKDGAAILDPSPAPVWTWPVDPLSYDRAAELAPVERERMGRLVKRFEAGGRGWHKAARPALARLLVPAHDTLDYIGATTTEKRNNTVPTTVICLLIRAMHPRPFVLGFLPGAVGRDARGRLPRLRRPTALRQTPVSNPSRWHTFCAGPTGSAVSPPMLWLRRYSGPMSSIPSSPSWRPISKAGATTSEGTSSACEWRSDAPCPFTRGTDLGRKDQPAAPPPGNPAERRDRGA